MVACIDNRTISLNITETLKLRLNPHLVRPQGTESCHVFPFFDKDPLDLTTAGKTISVLALFDVTTTDTDWREVGTALTEWTRTVRRHLDMEDDDNDE